MTRPPRYQRGRTLIGVLTALLLFLSLPPAHAKRARKAAVRSASKRSGPALFSRRHTSGSSATQLKRLLRTPGLRPRRQRADADSNRDFARDFLAAQRAGGATTWSNRPARRTMNALWVRLAPSLRSRFGAPLRRSLVMLRDDGSPPNAYALSDGRVVFYESYWQLCNSVAAAVSAAEGQGRRALTNNLREVAKRAKTGQYTVTFAGASRRSRSYRSALEGALSSVLAHELGHVALGHAADEVELPNASPGRDAVNQARRYLGRQKGVTADKIETNRSELVSQANEYDADFLGVDATIAAGVSPVGLIAEQVVSALMERKSPTSLSASHPPPRQRLRSTRDRLRQHKDRYDAETLDTVEAMAAAVLGDR